MPNLNRRAIRILRLAFTTICFIFIAKDWLERSAGGGRLKLSNPSSAQSSQNNDPNQPKVWFASPPGISDISKVTLSSVASHDSDKKILFAIDSPRDLGQRRSVMRSSWISHLEKVDKNTDYFFFLPASGEEKLTGVLKNEELANEDLYWIQSSSHASLPPTTVDFLRQYFNEECQGKRCKFQWLCKVHHQSYVSVGPLIENILRRSKSSRALVTDILPYAHYRMPLRESRASVDDDFFCITAELLQDVLANATHDKRISSLEDLIKSEEKNFTTYSPGSRIDFEGSVIERKNNSVSRHAGPGTIVVHGINADSQYLDVASKFDATGWIGGTEQMLLNSGETQIVDGTEDIFLLLKTGASVLWHRLPLHLSTTFRSIRTFRVYSDVADQILAMPVIDTFANMSEELASNSDDMNLVQILRRMHEERQNLGADALNIAKESWKLDRFKVAFALHHAWKTDSTKSWYVLVDDDTYVFWANLVPWLRELDPNDKLLLGNGVNDQFVHGGSGSVISRGLMHQVFEAGKDNWLKEWEFYSEKDCCGDRAFGLMVRDKYNVTGNRYSEENGPREPGYPFSYKRFQKEDKDFVRIAPINFCSPVGTLHHLTIPQVSELRRFERLYGSDPTRRPLVYGNLYEYYSLPFITSTPRRDWDNMPVDDKDWTLRDNVDNLAECQKLCYDDQDCYQYQLLWRRGTNLAQPECIRAHFFTFGRHLSPRDLEERSSISGWQTDRIKKARKSVDCQDLIDVNGPFNPRGLSEGWFYGNASEFGMSEKEFEKEKERVNGNLW